MLLRGPRARRGEFRRGRSIATAPVATALALAIAGCGSDGGSPPPGTDPPAGSPPSPRDAQVKPPTGDGHGGVRLQKLGEFEQPLYVAEAPGGEQIYVVEKTGRVRVIEDGRTLPTPFLDLSGDVSTSSEQGLLSIAFAPDYEASRLLYAYYTDLDGNQRVVSYRARSRHRVDEKSRDDLLLMEDFASNHNGGLLIFGPDGLLYIGTGDGGGGGDPERNAQDLSSPLGKILRIDPRPGGRRPYRVPPGNPFADRAGARPEIYAYGLRNPWRFSFDRETGALTIGDVGQDAFEEINHLRRNGARGANFGWSAFEGGMRFNGDQEAPGHIPPVLTYGRDRGCSVTGGHVVRDRGLRSLYGRYLYADFCLGELRSVILGEGKASGDRLLGLTVPSLSSFGEGNTGTIYVASLSGPVFRLAPE